MIKPIEIRYVKKSNIVFIKFEDGISENLTVEYLRCFSPSAEVKGHGPGQEVLQTGKENVGIDNIEQVGNYAVKIIFDDGENKQIYTFENNRMGTPYEQSFYNQMEHFVAMVQKKVKPKVTLTKGIEDLELCRAILKEIGR